MPPYERPRRPDRRGRAADRRVRGGPGARRGDAPDGDRRDPGGDGAVPPRQARPRHPHRDVHRRRGGPGRSRRDHRRPQGEQPRQDRDRVPDGHAAALRLRRRQPDGRDAAGRLHERHPRHPAVPPDDRDQLGASRSTSPVRWCADSIGQRLYSGVGGQMDFIRGAALAAEGRAIIALPSVAAGKDVCRIVPRSRKAPAS